MNVFCTHPDPVISAANLCDRHVVKMVLESAQLLCTYIRVQYDRDDDFLYRPTHVNHPCSIALRDDPGYLAWTVAHALALCLEYTARYGKTHKSQAIIRQCIDVINEYESFDDPNADNAPLCMPDTFKCSDVYLSYRNYVAHKYDEWRDAGRPARFKNDPGRDYFLAQSVHNLL